MVKTSLYAFVLVVVALLVYAASRPDSFRIERSAVIQAPPEKIFPHINSFQRWSAWSPWEKVDPALSRSFAGPDQGVGAIYGWKGNKEVGEGRMEIVESAPPGRIVIRIDFQVPFEAHNTVEFTLVPEAGGTRVSHAMYGPRPFVSKLMGLFFSMDKMVGGKFEEGLGALKALAETP